VASSLLVCAPKSDDAVGMEKEGEELTARVQELRSNLEKVQGQQVEDSRTMSKQQKTTERYLAKRQMLMTRKDECNRNIRDLGVLPEEAFEKYVNEKLEKVCVVYDICTFAEWVLSAHEKTPCRQRRFEKVCPC